MTTADSKPEATASTKTAPQPTAPTSSDAKSASSPAKKRKRVAKPKQTKKVVDPQQSRAQPPTQILILDNGGDTIKFGWNTENKPQFIKNVTARLQQQWTVLAGDQLEHVKNPNQLIHVTRSTERGIIVNFGNQVQVWKRMLDLLGVAIPLTTETAKSFGWKSARISAVDAANLPTKSIAPQNCAVLIALAPHCPRLILDQIVQTWMEDFGFSHVGFCVSPVCAAVPHKELRTACVVDVGWSATHICPTYQGRVLDHAIRRVSVAGRHLINMYKYFVSYRQWNLMDQEWILEQVLRQTAFVSMQFPEDMQLARRLPAGKRPYDREFVLPDDQNNFQGSVQLPLTLQQQQAGENEEKEEDDEEDEDVDEKEMEEAENDEEGDGDDEEGEGGSDEEESPEQIRRRLLKQREEEQRRQMELEEQQQVLNLSVERFSIPEALFRPQDAGLPSDWAGLPEAIVQSIEACPNPFPVALYRSIHLVGSLSQLPNLRERLERELRILAPCEYEVVVSSDESPVDRAWQGACQLSKQDSFEKWSISRDEWEAAAKRGAWRRLLVSEGGVYI